MKIRSIELTNIRRFAGRRARIDTIGDGITVLSEPNEFGKSTFFDALHALFFERHRSTKAAVKALQPHSGGAPEVQVSVELPEGTFLLRKRWLSRQTAQVHDSGGRLIAQDDEAEAWIDRLLGQGLAGPSGLLWVRQGVVGLEPAGSTAADKGEREQSLTARRDLLSSVAGEIELMTGGRRMDAVLARVGQDLARLATVTLKPKADGDWRRALDEAQKLSALRDDLAEKARRLSGELAQRAKVTGELRRLSDPGDLEVRLLAIQAARKADDVAQAHATRIGAAEQAAKLAELTLDRSEREAARLSKLVERVKDALKAKTEFDEKAEKAGDAAGELQQKETEAAEALNAAKTTSRDLGLRLAAAQKDKAAAAAQVRADQLRTSLRQAEANRDALDAARAARALIRVTERAFKDAETAQSNRDRLTDRIAAQSASVSFTYSSSVRVLCQGAEIATGPHRISRATKFGLPGIGELQVDPGEATGTPDADLAALNVILAQKLATCDAEDLSHARKNLVEALRLDEEIRIAHAVLKGIAPDGTDALHQAVAKAEAEAGQGGDKIEDEASVAGALTEAERVEAAAHALSVESHARAVAAGNALAGAVADRGSSDRALAASLVEAGDADALATRQAEVTATLPTERTRRDLALGALENLRATAPDLATTGAALARAETADAQNRRDRAQFQEQLATLNGSIGALADQGIEEALGDVTGRLTVAEARAARYEAEVQALDHLRHALEAARRFARDAYFQPVLKELEPLLAILHPGAHLHIDDQSLLPTALTRDGQEEALDILSGGTREQVAILTRLAFARLFAQAGRPVPVILDDALVHSDDDRIEAMFTALHRVAKDQQILVLTCRQRAFASLGGERARVRVDVL